MSRYRRNWKRSLKRYGMEDLGGPHLMRHTATLHWLQDLGFEFGRAQDRGRWLEEKKGFGDGLWRINYNVLFLFSVSVVWEWFSVRRGTWNV